MPSEVLAAEAVSCLNRAMAALRDIWEEIGIPEEQRLERTDVVRKHIKVSAASPVLLLSLAAAARDPPSAGSALLGAPGVPARLLPLSALAPCSPVLLGSPQLARASRGCPAAVLLPCP